MKINESSIKITDYTHTVETWGEATLEKADQFKIVVRPQSFEDSLLIQDATIAAGIENKLSATSTVGLALIRDRIVSIEFEYALDGKEIDVSTGEAFFRNGPKMRHETAMNLYFACAAAINACDEKVSEDTPAFLLRSDSPAGS